MAFIDQTYYSQVFHGADIPSGEFARYADDASEIIRSIVQKSISAEEAASDEIKRATCYQVEMMFAAGGIQKIEDSAVNGAIASETLDDYSVHRSQESNDSQSVRVHHSIGGFPVSPMSVMILKRAGFMKRWAFSEVPSEYRR